MDFTTLKQRVVDNIYQNNNEEITGQILQDTLIDIIDEIYLQLTADGGEEVDLLEQLYTHFIPYTGSIPSRKVSGDIEFQENVSLVVPTSSIDENKITLNDNGDIVISSLQGANELKLVIGDEAILSASITDIHTGDIKHLITKEYLQDKYYNKEDIDDLLSNTNTPEFVSITENDRAGWGLKYRFDNANNYGDIGNNAIDLSISNSASSTMGATGGYSVSFGFNSIASGLGSFVGGYSNSAGSYGEAVIGLFSSPATSPTAGSYVATDRVFVVGNGTNNANRSNAFIIQKNGLATLPSVTNTLIDAEPTGKAITTKEWVNLTINNSVGDYIPLSQKGIVNGVATLDSGGKVPASQLPSTVMTLEGSWNALTNTPTLTNGVGDAGQVYECATAGEVNFGDGIISFAVGDWAVYGADNKWYKSLNSNAVTSVNGMVGTILLGLNDLNDTPNNYTGANGKLVSVNSNGNGIEYREISGDDFGLLGSSIPMWNGTTWNGLTFSNYNTNNTIAQRTSTGTIRVNNATHNNDAVTLSQLNSAIPSVTNFVDKTTSNTISNNFKLIGINGCEFRVNSANYFEFYSSDSLISFDTSDGQIAVNNTDNTSFVINSNGISFETLSNSVTIYKATGDSTITLPNTTTNRYLTTSVNGVYADINGNIEVSAGISTITSDVGLSVTNVSSSTKKIDLKPATDTTLGGVKIWKGNDAQYNDLPTHYTDVLYYVSEGYSREAIYIYNITTAINYNVSKTATLTLNIAIPLDVWNNTHKWEIWWNDGDNKKTLSHYANNTITTATRTSGGTFNLGINVTTTFTIPIGAKLILYTFPLMS